jgi:arsenite/tail-anchored protein-transporting ATPase
MYEIRAFPEIRDEENRMRIIFFAGKGGVGKTSVAAATGLKAAQLGKRTIILSLDVAHSLSDIFDLEKELLDHNKGKPVKVSKNLWIQELDIQEEIEKNWGAIHKYVSTLFNTSGLDEILAEELAVLPGMEEVSLLLYINQYVRHEEYDVIILDCAPTGESLRFISIPTTLEWYIKKIFRIEKAVARYVRPVAKKLYDIPLPGNDYFDAIERLFQRLRGVDQILTDPETTSVRLVTNPEKIVLKETQRAFMYFYLYKMHIDAVIVNRVFPQEVNDGYFSHWRKSQGKYLSQAKEYFAPIPVLTLSLFRDEVLGPKRLTRLGDELYGDRDPLGHFFLGQAFQLSKENGEYRLRLKLPFVDKQNIELNKSSDELIVRVGSFKMHLLLPRQVAAAPSVRARLDNQYLQVYFGGEKDG